MKRSHWMVLALATVLTACAAESTSLSTRGTLAQRRGGGGATTCRIDTDCRGAIPPARRCADGSPNTASLCCRMGYCGICWSDCPSAGRGTSENNEHGTL